MCAEHETTVGNELSIKGAGYPFEGKFIITKVFHEFAFDGLRTEITFKSNSSTKSEVVMKRILHPSLTLGARDPFLSQKTAQWRAWIWCCNPESGDIPWRPDFGCDVTGLAGEPATPARVQETRALVERTIQEWLPDDGQ